ncbi:unnamed protein product [Cylicocyclus nassatus]|uniref:Uncharacterized protein n=1 Tax=Cylicocyclus nassatus TaxID=53992 RepID=A0AA36GEK5_CYLNA|nr:unnamed protein product [Cylicocyclus nassatus]
MRLAVYHYLHYLMSQIKIAPELFSEAAYKTARKEVHVFLKVIEGLMRLELKENASEIDVIAVMKTRQAIRMMSFQLQETLNTLKAEGFMPPDAKEKWSEVVSELHDRGDGILWIPQIAFLDWLECVKWIAPLRASGKQKIIELLSETLSHSVVRKLNCGVRIHTDGKTMWFLKKGVCKITEWVPYQVNRHHEVHAGEGEFIAERNILKYRWKGKKLPLTWPRRRYETTTYCEMIEISEEIIGKMLKIEPSIYTIINNNVQADRLITELRHIHKEHDIVTESFWSTFARCGKSLSKAEKLTVPEGRQGIVGCWTQITLIAPRKALNNDLYIRGPATLWLEPADKRGAGMVFFDKLRYENNDNRQEEISSCISFIREGPEKKLLAFSVEE